MKTFKISCSICVHKINKPLYGFLFLTAFMLLVAFTIKAQPNPSINKLTASYIDLKNALVADNSKLAADRAKILLTNLSLPAQALNAGQQKTWGIYIDKLKFDSRHISETDVIDHQREHFASLSKNMFALLSGLKLNSTTLYEQYCPMKRSYWLSETENIRNPYYGKEMISCGTTKATLKPEAK